MSFYSTIVILIITCNHLTGDIKKMCGKVCKFIINFISNCLYFIPCTYVLFFSGERKYRCIKCGCGFLSGVLLGVVFYEMIIVDLDFSENTTILIGCVVSLMLGVATSISKQIRCIIVLSFPTIGGLAGRSVLKTLVLVYLIGGPIANLATNGREVARTFSCTTSLTLNLTKTRFHLMFKPFQEALFGMKSDTNEIKDTISSIKDITAPLTGELEGDEEMRRMKEENDYLDAVMNDTKRSEQLAQKYNTTGEKVEAERFRKKYLEKIESRCEGQLTKAGNKCRQMFGTAYDKCYDTVTWFAAWLLCWPMKLTFVCNIIQSMGGQKACDPSKDIDSGFGEGYSYLKHSREKLTQNFQGVKFQYKISKIRNLIDFQDASDTSKTVLHLVNKKKHVMDLIMHMIQRIIVFIVMRILFNAQVYHDKYLSDIKFNNIYITSYFRKIDARRHLKNKSTLFPLKKIEKTKLIDPFSIKTLKRERQQLFGNIARLLLEMTMISDHLFYEALDLIRRHAEIDYLQTGHHDMLLQVKGTGLIASLLRSVVKGFNIKKRIKIARSNKACLPRASLLATYYLRKIYGMYLLILLLIFMDAYINRMRMAICAFFYYKHEKRRILYLYNEMTKRRMGFSRYMKKKLTSLIREQRLKEEYNIFCVIRLRWPRLARCLYIFPGTRSKCLICQEPEPCFQISNVSKFIVCKKKICPALYCPECWKDLDKTCYACCVTLPVESDYSDSDST